MVGLWILIDSLLNIRVHPVLPASQLRSLDFTVDFTVTRFLMKLFRSCSNDLITECREYFDFSLPSELVARRKEKFTKKFNSCSSLKWHFGLSLCILVGLNICFFLFILFILHLLVFCIIVCYICLLPLVCGE